MEKMYRYSDRHEKLFMYYSCNVIIELWNDTGVNLRLKVV